MLIVIGTAGRFSGRRLIALALVSVRGFAVPIVDADKNTLAARAVFCLIFKRACISRHVAVLIADFSLLCFRRH